MDYLLGFVLVLAEKIITSIANIFDSKLSRQTFKSVWSLVFCNGLLIILALPILFLFLHPKMISVNLFLIILVVAFIEFFYQIPYYKALQHADTSAVVSLFNIGKIFVPIFAYLIAHEILSPLQYVGFSIIIFSSVAISFDRKNFKINKAFYYMVPVTLLLAIDAAFQKEGLNLIDWKTFYFWVLAFSGLFSLMPVISKKIRNEIMIFVKAPMQRKYMPLYLQSVATWIGGGLDTLAISFLPVSIVRGFGSFQSLAVHIISSKEGKNLDTKPEIFSWKKVVLFISVGIGVLLTVIN